MKSKEFSAIQEAVKLNYKVEKAKTLIFNMGWDYDRMSQSGQQYYNELCLLLNIEP
jgi:hypothetical protein